MLLGRIARWAMSSWPSSFSITIAGLMTFLAISCSLSVGSGTLGSFSIRSPAGCR